MTNEEYLEKYQKLMEISQKNKKTKVLEDYHNPMSDEEFMKALKQFE